MALATWTRNGVDYDYAIGGLPFFNGIDAPNQAFRIRTLERDTAPYRKQQFDNARNPGEQSLAFWWMRSQMSFHNGAGLEFLDSEAVVAGETDYRFFASSNVDVSVAGKLTLSPNPYVAASTGAAGDATFGPIIAYRSGAWFLFWCRLSAGTWYLQSVQAGVYPNGSAQAKNITVDVAETPTDLFLGNGIPYLCTNKGMYQITGASTTAAPTLGAKTWDWTAQATTEVAAGYVHGRIVVGLANSLYQLVGTGPAMPSASYTHPDSSWVWTTIFEGPSAIYAAGYSANTRESAVYKFILDNTGALPTLTSGIVACTLPPQEQIYSAVSVLGTFVALGTNKGVRVGNFDGAGDIKYGPLVYTQPDTSAPVRSLLFEDHFIYASYADTTHQIVRVDLNRPLSNGSYAWANWVNLSGEAVVGLVKYQDEFVNAVTSGSVVYQMAVHPDGSAGHEFAASGSLTTSRIRFETLEPKLFKYAAIRTEPLVGSVSVVAITPNGAQTTLATYNTAGQVTYTDAAIDLGPQDFVQLRLDLTRSASSTSPTVNSYQLKALPASKNQRLLNLTLMCFDIEQDAQGYRVAGDGMARLIALERLEEARDVVQFQDLTREDGSNDRLVVIDEVNFVQTTPPESANGFGGYIRVSLRTVD